MDNNSNSNTNKTNKKQIAIFGGAFDPPIIAHIQIACEIYNNIKSIDEVWVVPCGDGRLDKTIHASALDRFKMLQLIKEDLVDLEVPIYIDDTEVVKREFIQSIDLVQGFQAKYPDNEFIFCIGADSLLRINEWDDYERLLNEYRFIVIQRIDTPFKADIPTALYPKQYDILETVINGSTSQVRKRLDTLNEKRINSGITGLTSARVIQYIQDNNLYTFN